MRKDARGKDIPPASFFFASGSLLAVFFHIFFEIGDLPGKGLSVRISQAAVRVAIFSSIWAGL